jgi:C-terminal processing protease CtpA/Prc
MNRRNLMTLALAIAAAFPSATNAADDKGWFGLAFNVETEGFSFNPTIQSVKIEKVAPSSPAAGAGLVAGDLVVALQGITIAGAKADDLQAAMKKSVGETLRFKIKRGNAEPFEVPLIAVGRPAGY